MAQVSSETKPLVTKTPRRSSSSTLEVLTEAQTPCMGDLHHDSSLSFNPDWKGEMTAEGDYQDFEEELVDRGYKRQESNVTMSMSWEHELDGEEVMVNEAVSPPSYESDLSECFEEESLASGLSETDSPSECENETERRTIPLGYDITADVPTEWENRPCCLVPWSPADRSDKLHTIRLGSMESLVSDIYETDFGTALEVFPFGAFVKIPVQLQTGRLAPEVLYDFIAKIKDVNYWNDVSAEYKGGYVCVLVERMEGLTVVARLKPEHHIVNPEGYLFVSEKDVRVEVNFPAGAVEKDTEFQFLLESLDPERLKEYKRYNPEAFSSILGFTSTLCVKHQMDHHLKRDVEVQLPIDDEEEYGDFDILFLRWEGEDVEVLDNIPSDEGHGIYTIAVDHFSDYSSIRVRHGADARRIAEEAKYASGRISLCTLLTFLTFEHVRNFPTILVDCVLSPRVNEVVAEHKKNGLQEIKLSRSRDLPVANHEKVQIDLAGNLTFAPGVPKCYYNLTFLTVAKSNFIAFPAYLRHSIGTYFSIINFRNEGKDWIHSIHFDLNIGPKNLNRNPTFECHQENTFAGTSKGHIQNKPRPETNWLLRQNESKHNSQKRTDPRKTGDELETPRRQSSSGDITPRLINTQPFIRQSDTHRAIKDPRVKREDQNMVRSLTCLSVPGTPGKVQTNPKWDRLIHAKEGENLKDLEATNSRWSTTPSLGWVDPGLKFSRDGHAMPATREMNVDIQPKISGLQKRHPILNEDSLAVLAEKGLPWAECQRVARELGISQVEMERIYEDVTRKQTDPSFKVMLYWVSVNRNRKDSDLVSDLVAAFREIGRNDVAEVILAVEKEQRRLWREDFVS